MEKYSVLMSLYEKEKPDFLVSAIESMITQTMPPDEIIIVEDGPIGIELANIVNSYKNAYQSLFTIVRNNANLGLGLALNEGLKVSRNDLVARMDTDDVSKPDRCEKQLRVFYDQPTLSIVGALVDEFVGSTDNIVSVRKVPEGNDEIYHFSKRRSAFNHPVVMYRRSAVLECGGYNDLRRNQDVDMFGRMMFAGYKAYNIQESLLLFRSSMELAKRRKSWSNTKSYIAVIKRFWKSGYASFFDYFIVMLAQLFLFVLPARLQSFIYKRFLRK